MLNDCKIEFSGMGLFMTDEEWIHPKRTEITYEIIYVTCGYVYLEENGKNYMLKKGDLIILPPNVCHSGSKISTGRTSFYWAHFFADKFSLLPVRQNIYNDIEKTALFKELIHCQSTEKDTLRCEIILSYILSGLFEAEQSNTSRLSAEIRAWVHANANASLSVYIVGKHFGYNCEHLSRIVKKSFGCTLKSLIDAEIIQSANNYLLNSNYSVKEIAELLRFDNANSFISFYKYHQKTTPTKFRNLYPLVKINNK